MSFEERADAVIAALDREELKLVYRILHQHLGDHPELMDTDFLMELQNYLQRQARAEGIDIADHSKWDAWIGNKGATPCDERVAKRRPIQG